MGKEEETTADMDAGGRADGLLAAATARPRFLSRADLARLIAWPDAQALFRAALSVKRRVYGPGVAFRGLVELSNVCRKDCLYCGIRKSNPDVRRYTIGADEIVAAAKRSFEAGFGSIVLQSGERTDEAFVSFVEEILRRIREFGGDTFGITLSLGEQTEETYRRWREAGAHRYLLRIETSNPALYARLHPADHSWEARLECLRSLRRCGYQVGTGVMAGLPGQTMDDLAADIEFFAEEDVDMIGMGPYIPHPGTLLGRCAALSPDEARKRLELGLRLVAATRLHLHDVNIAAATALQALDPEGREKGLLAGANVVMPNATPVAYRADYTLYAGKPCLDEDAALCRECLNRRVQSTGGVVLWNERGDSPHFASRRSEAFKPVHKSTKPKR